MKVIKLLAVMVLLFISGCRNFYDGTTEYDSDGNITKQTYSAMQSKFTNKSVNFITEVQAIKATMTDPMTGGIFPQVDLGWFWTAFMEQNIKDGGRLVFYKESHSMFGQAITGKTLLYIENTSGKEKKITVTCKPKFLIDLPGIKIGAGGNIVNVKIENVKD
jgi:hypothetical protein